MALSIGKRCWFSSPPGHFDCTSEWAISQGAVTHCVHLLSPRLGLLERWILQVDRVFGPPYNKRQKT